MACGSYMGLRAQWWDNNGVSEDMFKRGWYNLLDACHDKVGLVGYG